MGNRFWEFYLVRYLLGTIFAIIILFYLFYNYNNEISNSFFHSQDSPQSAQSAVSGFLFDTTYTLQEDKKSSLLKWTQEILKSVGLENSIDSFLSNNINITLTQSGVTVLTTINTYSCRFFIYVFFKYVNSSFTWCKSSINQFLV
ncbi:hypothetical protein PO903_17870 [Paenibacillus sp. PK4536]|uniref:hypothetical protein n=1 Tax=Paenibacillus sp. PK4536 TaxID=3024576 RepID=UPI0023595E1A|nr:hypothetical protein [Paenibacillus sp. PK4536]WIM38499.1 hypothetical protein PO903_17870 [Paenibacillus sp. PK4536]